MAFQMNVSAISADKIIKFTCIFYGIAHFIHVRRRQWIFFIILRCDEEWRDDHQLKPNHKQWRVIDDTCTGKFQSIKQWNYFALLLIICLLPIAMNLRILALSLCQPFACSPAVCLWILSIYLPKKQRKTAIKWQTTINRI